MYLVTNQNLQRFFDKPGLLYDEDPTFQAYLTNAVAPRNAATDALNIPGFTRYAAVLSVHTIHPMEAEYRPTIVEWRPNQEHIVPFRKEEL